MRLLPRRTVTLLIGGVVFALCLRYILTSFRWAEILQVLTHVELGWWPIIALSIVVYWFLRTLRWLVLLRNIGVAVKLIDLYFCTSAGLSLALVTPLQSGEALKVELLKQRNQLDRSSGYGSFLVERVMDFLVVGILAVMSVLSNTSIRLSINRSIMVYGLLATLAVILVGWLVLSRLSLPGRVGYFLIQVKTSIGSLQTFMLVLLLTIASWTVVAVGWQMSLQSISVQVSPLQVLALMSTVTLINVLSFVPGAVGVSEVGIAELLIYWSHDLVSAQAGALILRVYGLTAPLVGAAHLLVWKVRLKRQAPVLQACGRPDDSQNES